MIIDLREIIIFIVLFFCFSSGLSQDSSFLNSDLKYYTYLDEGEFLGVMLPKEKFLLELMENINKEIHKRGIEGTLDADVRLEEIVLPDAIVLDNYEEEVNKVIDLLDEIKVLEREARKRVNFKILRFLSDLRQHVKEIINQSRISNVEKNDSITDYQVKKIEIENIKLNQAESGGNKNISVLDSWRYNKILDYNLNLIKYRLLRERLLRTSTPEQLREMFQRYLRSVLQNYSLGDFRLTHLQLKDIINTYNEYYLDDVLFYYGESCYALNYFDEAISCYAKLLKKYSQSSFIPKALIKLIYIYYIYNDFDNLTIVYKNFAANRDKIDNVIFGTVSYLVGYANYKKGDYRNAIKILGTIPGNVLYFYPSLYLAATCYSNIGRNDLTISIYKKILKDIELNSGDHALDQIRNNAVLKLGLIYFDQGRHDISRKLFNQIPEDYAHYDLSLLGRAWSAYESKKPIETLENTQELIKNSILSKYSYEAQILAAYSKSIIGRSDEAVHDLKRVYKVGEQKKNIIDDTGNLRDSEYYKDKNINDKSEEKKDIFDEISRIQSLLNKSESASVKDNSRFSKKILESDNSIAKQIAFLDSLEIKARESGSSLSIDEIRSLRSKLIKINDDQLLSLSADDSIDDPVLEYLGKEEYLKYTFRTLLMKTIREKEEIKGAISKTKKIISKAKQENRFELVNSTEIRQEEFFDYYNKLNQHEVWIRENYPEQFQVNLDQWAYFSGYGISDINFSRIGQLDEQIKMISNTIADLDHAYNYKENKLERQIKGLLNDVSELEEQMKNETRKEEKKQQKQFFEKKYFNKQLRESIISDINERNKSDK